MVARDRNEFVIVVQEKSGRAGVFEGRIKLDGKRALTCTSRSPLLDGARGLLADGRDPAATLVMRHSGSATDAMTAPIGLAATLTVKETMNGPRLACWNTFPADPVAPGIAPTEGLARPARERA